jgi:hypothetical protein
MEGGCQFSRWGFTSRKAAKAQRGEDARKGKKGKKRNLFVSSPLCAFAALREISYLN